MGQGEADGMAFRGKHRGCDVECRIWWKVVKVAGSKSLESKEMCTK